MAETETASGQRRPSMSDSLAAIVRRSSVRSSFRSELNRDELMKMMKSNSERRKVAARFIKTSQGDESSEVSIRNTIDKILRSTYCDLAIGTIVVIDFVTNAVSVDARAGNYEPPTWVAAAGLVALIVYTLEFTLTVFAKGCRSIAKPFMLVDLFILVIGYVEVSLEVGGVSLDSFSLLRLLRLVRILRLIKLFHKFKFLKELRKLISMAVSCAKTLAWSFLFCFIIMTAWSMAFVDLIYPTVEQLVKEGTLREKDSMMTQSVMNVNLMLFKTVIAGDGWGQIAIPVIFQSPFSALIFVGSHLTIVFGVLNLVVAVVVDTFAEQRQKDVALLAEEMEADEEADVSFLSKMFKQIDEDNSGELSLEELLNGARQIPEFQSRLRVMDIDEQDLEQLFYMLDEDNGGSIDSTEFINALSRWIHESKTANRFVKYNVEHLVRSQEQFGQELRDIRRRIDRWASQADRKQRTVSGDSPLSSDMREDARPEDTGGHISVPPELDLDEQEKQKKRVLAAKGFDETLRSAINDLKAMAVNEQELRLQDVEEGLLDSLRNMERELQQALNGAEFGQPVSSIQTLPPNVSHSSLSPVDEKDRHREAAVAIPATCNEQIDSSELREVPRKQAERFLARHGSDASEVYVEELGECPLARDESAIQDANDEVGTTWL